MSNGIPLPDEVYDIVKDGPVENMGERFEFAPPIGNKSGEETLGPSNTYNKTLLIEYLA